MNKETIELIDKLAAKLGTTAEHLWAVLMRQAPISALSDLLGLITAIIVLYFCVRGFARLAKRDDDSEWEVFAVIGLWIVAAIAGIVVIVGICSADLILAGFINPEYWAFKQIFR